MAAQTVTQLPGGVRVFQSELWATNSVIVPAPEGCLVCDPSIFPDEIAEIRTATGGQSPVHLLITHSDFDHVCGVPAFAHATVLTGAATAAALLDGTAARQLEEAGGEWGTAWDGPLRSDIVVGAEPLPWGGVTIAAVDCPGHAADGSAFVIGERGLLLAGDYLTAVCHPVVLSSVADAAASVARLLRAMDDQGVRSVVPGHGPVLDRRQAERIGAEDIEYLQGLQAAAAAAVRAGADAQAAVAAVRAVPSPRSARPDFEALDLLSSNAQVALAEAGHPAFQAPVTP